MDRLGEGPKAKNVLDTSDFDAEVGSINRGDVAMVQELERLMKPKVLTKVELEEPAQRSLNSLES